MKLGNYAVVYHKGGKGKSTRAHRVIAELALGKPLPQGAVVHHHFGDTNTKYPRQLVICQDQAYHMLIHARTRIYRVGGNPDINRICSTCKLLKLVTDFYKVLSDKHRYECLTCVKERAMLWRMKKKKKN